MVLYGNINQSPLHILKWAFIMTVSSKPVHQAADCLFSIRIKKVTKESDLSEATGEATCAIRSYSNE